MCLGLVAVQRVDVLDEREEQPPQFLQRLEPVAGGVARGRRIAGRGVAGRHAADAPGKGVEGRRGALPQRFRLRVTLFCGLM